MKKIEGFQSPIMEEQVRDNEAWDLLLFAVVYELAPNNLRQRSNFFFATTSLRIFFSILSPF